MKLPIFLVDDDAAVRDALCLYLEATGFTVRTFDSAEAFLGEIDEMGRGVLVLDQRMTGMSGLELQSELNVRGVEMPTIFITGHGDVPMSVRAMKEGATDFLEKPFRNSDLLASIEQVLAQDAVKMEDYLYQAGVREKYDSLTPREKEVMEHIVRGLPNKSVAQMLGVSMRTIEAHRGRVMEKMDARSLPDLVRMADFCVPGNH
ncbi:MAG: response regulator [Pseudomonadota bacterium]|nr:response regulator [Pseudomonadota bacterium]